VTRGGTRPIFALAAAALVALLLTACGGSDSSSSAESSASGSDGEASTEAGGLSLREKANSQSREEGQEQKQNGGGQEASQGRQRRESKPNSYRVAEVSAPLKVSGGGSEQFVVKGGDNSVQEYGDESDESELEAAAQVVHDFYVARATGHWSEACSLMSTSLLEQLEDLAAKSTKVKGCPPFLEAFTSPLPASAWREITTIDAGSLRRDGEQGFLIYTGASKTVYAMPLKEEDGAWRVTALSATTLG
jgi:hypothetical protein